MSNSPSPAQFIPLNDTSPGNRDTPCPLSEASYGGSGMGDRRGLPPEQHVDMLYEEGDGAFQAAAYGAPSPDYELQAQLLSHSGAAPRAPPPTPERAGGMAARASPTFAASEPDAQVKQMHIMQQQLKQQREMFEQNKESRAKAVMKRREDLWAQVRGGQGRRAATGGARTSFRTTFAHIHAHTCFNPPALPCPPLSQPTF